MFFKHDGIVICKQTNSPKHTLIRGEIIRKCCLKLCSRTFLCNDGEWTELIEFNDIHIIMPNHDGGRPRARIYTAHTASAMGFCMVKKSYIGGAETK